MPVGKTDTQPSGGVTENRAASTEQGKVAGSNEGKGKLTTGEGDYEVRLAEAQKIPMPSASSQPHTERKPLDEYSVKMISGEEIPRLRDTSKGDAQPQHFYASDKMPGDLTGAVGLSEQAKSSKKAKPKKEKKKMSPEEKAAKKKGNNGSAGAKGDSRGEGKLSIQSWYENELGPIKIVADTGAKRADIATA